MQQREVVEFVDGDDFDLLVGFAVKLAIGLMINLHGNFRLTLNDVEVRDEIAVGVDEKAGAEPFRRAHLHDRLADLFHQILHVARRRGPGVGGIKLRRIDADEQIGRGGRRRHGRGDLGNLRDDAARHDQHGVADIHNHRVGFLGEDGARNGVVAFELDGVRAREMRGAESQHQQRKLFLQQHRLTIMEPETFDKRRAREKSDEALDHPMRITVEINL